MVLMKIDSQNHTWNESKLRTFLLGRYTTVIELVIHIYFLEGRNS